MNVFQFAVTFSLYCVFENVVLAGVEWWDVI